METRKRFKDKVCILGFANTTRDLAPYDDDSYEIWTVNEAGAFPWIKRFDRLFQMHPRWDFTRKNNGNDPNHWLWLQNKSGTCTLCEGAGVYGKDKTKCPACDNGQYVPPKSREFPKVIYMQQAHSDIPGSETYPLKEMIALNPAGKYFTSSLSFMLILAAAMGYKEIFLAGFEMGNQTEYFYQRANAEYLIGYLTNKKTNIVLPAKSSICKGKLYAYENMNTGYRQQLDMRIDVLKTQIERNIHDMSVAEGEVKLWKKFTEMTEPITPESQLQMIAEAQSRYTKLNGLVNTVKGAQKETENLRDLYDRYFVAAENGNDEQGMREDTTKYVQTEYKAA